MRIAIAAAIDAWMRANVAAGAARRRPRAWKAAARREALRG